MAKAICGIPLSRIRRVEIYINESRNTLAEIKAATGAAYVLNGGLFEGTKAVCHLKGGGTEPTDEWPEYVQPTGAHDAYRVGDKVTFNGKRYVCKLANCVWPTAVYPAGWEEQTEA